jgi:hypothetical protein
VENAADVWYSARYLARPSQKKSIFVYGYGVKGVSVVQAAVPCQQHPHQVHAIRGVPGVHTS